MYLYIRPVPTFLTIRFDLSPQMYLYIRPVPTFLTRFIFDHQPLDFLRTSALPYLDLLVFAHRLQSTKKNPRQLDADG